MQREYSTLACGVPSSCNVPMASISAFAQPVVWETTNHAAPMTHSTSAMELPTLASAKGSMLFSTSLQLALCSVALLIF